MICGKSINTYAVSKGGLVVGEIYETKSKKFSKGDIVVGDLGWQQYAIVTDKQIRIVPASKQDARLFLSIYGAAGITGNLFSKSLKLISDLAYFGLLDIGTPKSGETIVVSSASSSVGLFVGQIAKIKGMTNEISSI